MKRIYTLDKVSFDSQVSTETQDRVVRALEDGKVLYFPSLSFALSETERRFLDPAILHRSKNVGFNPATGALTGTACGARDAQELSALLGRYADCTRVFLGRLLPFYGKSLRRERTSLRPARVEGRVTSWRKDDTRLHVDSFPSQPTQGRRLLRMFCNVNPNGEPRVWRAGEPFPVVARQFWRKLPEPRLLQRQVLAWLRVTKGLRSEYDHYMLHLHDAMKRDLDYQRNCDQETIRFPAGSAWACFTDQVSHAAMSGQHQFEQTFTLPADAQFNPATTPLAVLEKLAGRQLAPRALSQAA